MAAKRNNALEFVKNSRAQTEKMIGEHDAAVMEGAAVPVKSPIGPVSRTVPIENLLPHPKNTFTMEEDEEFKGLVESIRTDGILEPPIVKPDPENRDKFILISGHRRVKAAKAAGIDRVKVTVREFKNETEEYACLVAANTTTRQKKPMDMARAIAELDRLVNENDYAGGRKRDYIAQLLAINGKTVYNYSKLNELPPVAQTWVEKGYLQIKQAIEFLKYDEEIRGRHLAAAATVINDENAEKTVAKMLEDIKNDQFPREKREPASPRAVRYVQRAHKVLSAMPDNMVYPKQDRKKAELSAELDEMIAILNSIKDALK